MLLKYHHLLPRSRHQCGAREPSHATAHHHRVQLLGNELGVEPALQPFVPLFAVSLKRTPGRGWKFEKAFPRDEQERLVNQVGYYEC